MGINFCLQNCSADEMTAKLQEADDDSYDDVYESETHYVSAPHWSYSGFGGWRRDSASRVGIDLDDMVGFGGKIPFPEWNASEPSLIPLLNHSDCDGSLSPTEARSVAAAMRNLGMVASDDSQGGLFLQLLDEAVERQLHVGFC